MGVFYSKAVENATRQFVDAYGKDIAAAIKGTGLYFSAVVAQKCLESTYGRSELAAKHNNFGGIKNFGSVPGAGVVMMDTTEIVHGIRVKKKQPFATFSSPRAAFAAFVKLLQDPAKKYRNMGVFEAPTAEEQILRIARAGYTTTAPETYLKSMKGIMNACKDIYGLGLIN